MPPLSKLATRKAIYARQAANAAIARARVGAASAMKAGFDAAREEARINSYTAPTIVLSASDAGDGTATIRVIAHTRVYPIAGSLDVPDVAIAAADITGQPLNTANLSVYYDDTTLADTTPAFLVTADPAVAQVGAAAGRHLVGRVTTPAAGSPPSTGSGGSNPPGGGGGGGGPALN
jgi:hypothetical protein